MSWLSRFFSAPPGEYAERLRAWEALPTPGDDSLDGRFVVADVESSGLNTRRDRLLAIGAVAVREGRVAFGDSFEVILLQSKASSHDNILIHGIGGTEQTESGIDPREALMHWLEYSGKNIRVGYHAPFDQIMIRKSVKEQLGLAIKAHWIDLAMLAPALLPREARHCKALDHWLEHFGIHNYARHNATADALATAQLFVVLRDVAMRKGHERLSSLLMLESDHRHMLGQSA